MNDLEERLRILLVAIFIFIAFSNIVYSMDINDAIDDEYFVKSGGEELYIKVRGQNLDNPALLSRVEWMKFSLVNLPVTINDNVVDISKFIDDNQENFENYNDLGIMEKSEFIDDIQEYDGQWSRVNVSPLVDLAVNIIIIPVKVDNGCDLKNILLDFQALLEAILKP